MGGIEDKKPVYYRYVTLCNTMKCPFSLHANKRYKTPLCLHFCILFSLYTVSIHVLTNDLLVSQKLIIFIATSISLCSACISAVYARKSASSGVAESLYISYTPNKSIILATPSIVFGVANRKSVIMFAPIHE